MLSNSDLKKLPPTNIKDKIAAEAASRAVADGKEFRDKPSVEIVRDLTMVADELRHACLNLMDGAVTNQPDFARARIAPQIERIGKVIRRLS